MPLRVLGTMPECWWQGMARGGWLEDDGQAPAVCAVGSEDFPALRAAVTGPETVVALWLGVPTAPAVPDGLKALETLGFSLTVTLWQPLLAVFGDSKYRFPYGELGLDVLQEAMPGLGQWTPTRIGSPPDPMPPGGVLDVVAVRHPELERGLRFASALAAPALERTAQLRIDALFVTKYAAMLEQAMAVFQSPPFPGQGA
ncbi:MAG TPA: hypothetical protein VD860_09660 [Azospirillum sp.]|nr:hypothetical protein [Azospirillum sp.]